MTFGLIDYTSNPPLAQQPTYEEIKAAYEQKLNAGNKLEAVQYLIDTYQMKKFGSTDISNQTYQIEFVPGTDPIAITNKLQVVSTGEYFYKTTINDGLLTYEDFTYIIRALRHELYHVLQGVTTPDVEHNLREFDAYYNSIFKFKSLPAWTSLESVGLLAQQAHKYYGLLTQAEKALVTKEYNILNAYYPIVKSNPIQNCP